MKSCADDSRTAARGRSLGAARTARSRERVQRESLRRHSARSRPRAAARGTAAALMPRMANHGREE